MYFFIIFNFFFAHQNVKLLLDVCPVIIQDESVFIKLTENAVNTSYQ